MTTLWQIRPKVVNKEKANKGMKVRVLPPKQTQALDPQMGQMGGGMQGGQMPPMGGGMGPMGGQMEGRPPMGQMGGQQRMGQMGGQPQMGPQMRSGGPMGGPQQSYGGQQQYGGQMHGQQYGGYNQGYPGSPG